MHIQNRARQDNLPYLLGNQSGIPRAGTEVAAVYRSAGRTDWINRYSPLEQCCYQAEKEDSRKPVAVQKLAFQKRTQKGSLFASEGVSGIALSRQPYQESGQVQLSVCRRRMNPLA